MTEKVYNLAEFAESVRISADQVQKHMNGELVPFLDPGTSGKKPLFTESDREAFLAGLPRRSERVS